MKDLLRWALVGLSTRDVTADLEGSIRARFGVRAVVLTSTGRAGLTLLLRALRRLAPRDRDEVVLPAYTCYSVAAAVAKAGLHPRIVDVSPDTLDYIPDQLSRADFSRVLALVATNLYGLPNDMARLSSLAKARGVFLVDDAAQAMGASVLGRPCGTWGDAGLFSFDKGKNVSAMEGGVVVTNSSDVAAALMAESRGLGRSGPSAGVTGILKAVAYAVLLRPWLYGIPSRMPSLGLGRTVFTTDFAVDQPHRALVALGAIMLRRLDEFTLARTENAARLQESLAAVPSLGWIRPAAGATPAWLRLPVLLRDEATRDRAVARLQARGIGATASYPASIADIPALAGPRADVPGGREVARRVLTLPTHPYVTARDIESMTAELLHTQASDAPCPEAMAVAGCGGPHGV